MPMIAPKQKGPENAITNIESGGEKVIMVGEAFTLF
jgi:hypothetical protein